MNVTADVVLYALGKALSRHFLRNDVPMDVIPRPLDSDGIDTSLSAYTNSGEGPLCELRIRRHERDTDRDQNQVPLAYLYEDRATGDRTVEEYDPRSPLPPPSERIRVGEIVSYIYEMAVDVTITVPLADTTVGGVVTADLDYPLSEADQSLSLATYTRTVPVLDPVTGLPITETVTDPETGDQTQEPAAETRTFEYRSTREYERVLADALERHTPTLDAGNKPLPDPRPPAERDDVLDDVSGGGTGDSTDDLLDVLLAVSPGPGEDRDEPTTRDSIALRVWEQRIELEYYRLVSTLERDGPVEVITEVDVPHTDEWISVDPETWKGTLGALSPNITPPED